MVIEEEFLASVLSGIGIMTASLPALGLVIDINTYVTGSTFDDNPPEETVQSSMWGALVPALPISLKSDSSSLDCWH